MKTALGLLLTVLLTLACGTAGALGARSSAASVRVSGREYVQVATWARANGLEPRWLKRDASIQLSNPSTKILLAVDSSEAQVNGVQVRLLFPVLAHNGSPYLAQLDAQTTFQPLLYPPRERGGFKIKSICLDPGHGGKDPGFQVSGHDEKKYTLLLAQELRDQLARAGFKVSLTRTRDTFLELQERPDLAKRRGADLFVSLHFNAVPSSTGSVQGAEVYCLTPAGAPSTNARGQGAGAGVFAGNQHNEKNLLLAYQVQKAMTQGMGVEDRGVHRARWAVLRDAVMPAVLIEGGYMSHPSEGKKIFDAAYRRQLARGMVDGISAYKRMVER
jgi:N-acetylmuramoyl-L-alanine amidase